ncbi:MAG: NifX-associated nitrogen fixation protein [Rhodospirillales bacterium]|nr:NifX-associated nitrogen fixation protein [Rhodospirillales bacterium]
MTPDAPLSSEDDSEAAALATPFIRALVRQMRAHDTTGFWERKSDSELLAGYIVTRAQRRTMPIIGDPDAKLLWRIDQYYAAVGLALEQRVGMIATPIIKLTHEGFGRVVLIVGKLVVTSRVLRDVNRFGFESLAVLAAEGEKLVADAAKNIEAYPEVAQA